MNRFCKECMLRKHLNNYPEGTPDELVKEYQSAVIRLMDQEGAVPTGPEVFLQVKEFRKRLFGEGERDYSEIKKQFNALMLGLEEKIEHRILNSPDPLKTAVQYAMMGNYIDFAALDNVEESRLLALLDSAPEILVDTQCLEQLREHASEARRLVYITDNCGEIVLDKLLMRQICRMNPETEIIVILRGAPVANDATMEDAAQVGLTGLWRYIGNGTKVDGTVMRALSREAREAIIKADLVIAKGQANYETLYGCGSNIFYIFMCKCELFMSRFQVPQFTGIMTREDPGVLMRAYADPDLLERFEFQSIHPDEAVQAGEIEAVCFIPEEACPMEEMTRRVSVMPEQFLVAVDRETGLIAGFLNGIASNEERFQDVFFTDVTLNDPLARTVFLMGLDVLPAYRGQGLAAELVRLYVIREQVRGRRRLVLTSHAEKKGMYEKMGFRDLGISDSVWGGTPWHEMEYQLDC